jgi:hypothetical protein
MSQQQQQPPRKSGGTADVYISIMSMILGARLARTTRHDPLPTAPYMPQVCTCKYTHTALSITIKRARIIIIRDRVFIAKTDRRGGGGGGCCGRSCHS